MTTRNKEAVTVIDVSIRIKQEEVQSLLVSAFEGGSNYWYRNLSMEFEPGYNRADFEEGGRYYDPDWSVWYAVPFVNGCFLTFDVDMNEDGKLKKYKVGKQDILRALKLMAEKYGHHFAALMTENADRVTGDVFLQLCAFGDIVFG